MKKVGKNCSVWPTAAVFYPNRITHVVFGKLNFLLTSRSFMDKLARIISSVVNSVKLPCGFAPSTLSPIYYSATTPVWIIVDYYSQSVLMYDYALTA